MEELYKLKDNERNHDRKKMLDSRIHDLKTQLDRLTLINTPSKRFEVYAERIEIRIITLSYDRLLLNKSYRRSQDFYLKTYDRI